MFTKDTSQAQVDAAVSEVKSAVSLVSENQSPEFSGHESAEYGKGGGVGEKQVGE